MASYNRYSVCGIRALSFRSSDKTTATTESLVLEALLIIVLLQLFVLLSFFPPLHANWDVGGLF